MKTNIGVAIAVLQTNHEVADDGYAGAVTLELLVGELSVILLRLKELVVEVKVVFLALYELARRYQYVKQQVVELVAVLKSYCLPVSEVYVVFSCFSSSMIRSMVSELHDLRRGWCDKWRRRCEVTSPTQDPPQRYTHINVRMISLYW